MPKDIDKYMMDIEKNILLPRKDVKMKKINTDDIEIPTVDTIDLLLTTNYNRNQLKIIVKHYKIKQSGNKNEVQLRIYRYLVLSKQIITIQRVFRGYLYRNYIAIRGPGLKNRNKCVNPTDFLSMEELQTIDNNQFFSYEDKDGFIYGFDILSLFNLIQETRRSTRILRRDIKNPYNRASIPRDIIRRLYKVLRVAKILHVPITLDIPSEEQEEEVKSVQTIATELFMTMDRFGHYTNPSWFLSLDLHGLRRFVRELTEIWNYRAGLTRQVKREICPHGDPLSVLRYSFIFANEDPEYFEEKQRMILDCFKRLITSGVNEDSKSLGVYYILGALCLVNRETALGIPWLYDSFRYI